MTKILLVGAVSSKNYGDNIICNTSLKLLSSFSKSNEVELVNIDFTSYKLGILKRVFRFLRVRNSLYDTIRNNMFNSKINKSDCIVFAGGQMFFNYFIPFINEYSTKALFYKKNVYYYGCGFGPLSNYNEEILKNCLNNENVCYVGVRDHIEYAKFLCKCSVLVPDVAICCREYYGDFTCIKENSIGVGVIDPYYYNQNNSSQLSLDQYLSLLLFLIKSIINQGYNVFLFCNGDEKDRIILDKVYESCVNNFMHVSKCSIPKNDNELVELISSFTYVMASRLHALIVSYSYNIPAFGLVWDEKIPDFYKMIYHEKRHCNLLSIKDVDWDVVIDELHTGVNLSRKQELIDKIHKSITIELT